MVKRMQDAFTSETRCLPGTAGASLITALVTKISDLTAHLAGFGRVGFSHSPMLHAATTLCDKRSLQCHWSSAIKTYVSDVDNLARIHFNDSKQSHVVARQTDDLFQNARGGTTSRTPMRHRLEAPAKEPL